MSELGGLWQRQNDPASAKSVKSLQNVKVGHYAQVDEGRDVERTGRGRHAGTSSTGAMPLRAAQMMGQQKKKIFEVRGKCHDCPGKHDSRIKPQMMGQQKRKGKKKNKNRMWGKCHDCPGKRDSRIKPPGAASRQAKRRRSYDALSSIARATYATAAGRIWSGAA